MSKEVNVWIAFSGQALSQYTTRRAADADGEEYTGPMDDTTYGIMRSMQAHESRQRLYKTPSIAGKTYTLFSLDFSKNLTKVKEAIDWVSAEWPSHIIIIGAWWYDTGLQAGTENVLDDDGEVIGIAGEPMYPIPAAAYKLMPDTYTYTAEGEIDGSIPATSNAQLRDVNLVAGQAPRMF